MIAGLFAYIFIFFEPREDYHAINVVGANWGNLEVLTEKQEKNQLDIDLEGKIVAVFFGYLACPDFCPNHLSKMVLVKNMLPEKIRDQFAVIFISVDPERDKTINLKKFLRSFDQSFDGFVPDKKHLSILKDEFKLVINKSSKNEFGNYLVDHYTYTYLYDMNKNLRLLIPFEMSIEKIVKDIKGVNRGQF
ncbi:MAG: hypothetical protein CMK52_01205 [Proteobacteria bacterium]|nr:hypothetical protein [Pseudomonadota bacterium]